MISAKAKDATMFRSGARHSYGELNLTLDLTLDPQGCSQKRKIALAKTHKTASR